MKVWSTCASISVTITDIWTKFSTERKYHTVNTPEWPNSHKVKIQDGGRHLEFRLYVNKSGLDKDILHQIIWEDASRHAEMTTWPKVETGSQFAWRHQMNRWSICASISVTIIDIWIKFGTEHKCHTVNTPEWPNSHKLNIQYGGGRHLEFQGNVNNSTLDTDIYTKFYGKMHHGHAEMNTSPIVETGWKLIRETS